MRKTFDLGKHEMQIEINIEVLSTERDGINMLNHSGKKSYLNSYMLIHSISSLEDITLDKRNIMIEDINSSHILDNNNITNSISNNINTINNNNSHKFNEKKIIMNMI